jgi:outer membrane protein W
MRKSIIAIVSLLFVVAPLYAQQPNRSNAVTLFLSDAYFGSDSRGSHAGADFGLALSHMFNDRFSGELAVTSQRIGGSVTTVPFEGFPTTVTYSGRVHPIDAIVSYHFLTDSRWKPYLGAGARYVSDSARVTSALVTYRLTRHSTDPEITGGITFQFNPRLGLRFDARQTLGSSSDIGADAKLQASAGLSLRF